MKSLLSSAIAVLISVATLLPSPTHAQSRDHVIQIVEDAGMCVYTIPEADDRGTFVVSPGDRIVPKTEAPLRVSIALFASDEGLRATEGINALMATRDTDRGLKVRAPVGKSSEHDLLVQCCIPESRQAETCTRWRTAVRAPLGGGARLEGTGGPRMRVDE